MKQTKQFYQTIFSFKNFKNIEAIIKNYGELRRASIKEIPNINLYYTAQNYFDYIQRGQSKNILNDLKDNKIPSSLYNLLYDATKDKIIKNFLEKEECHNCCGRCGEAEWCSFPRDIDNNIELKKEFERILKI